MAVYVLLRAAQSVVTLIGLSAAVFFLAWAVGEPMDYLSPGERQRLREEAPDGRHGLDRPLIVQYGEYLSRLARADLGPSPSYGRRPVTEIIGRTLGPTLHLGGMALGFVLLVGLTLGVTAAYSRGTLADTLARLIALAGYSIPQFWLALMLILVFGVHLQWLPIAGREGGWQHWVMPTLAAGWLSAAILTRVTRSAVLEAMTSDYVRTARAKGLPERAVLLRHALRSSLITVITATALVSADLLAGVVMVETVFGWPGMGRLAVRAMVIRDLFLLQGVILIVGSVLLTANFAADVGYRLLDPRLRSRYSG